MVQYLYAAYSINGEQRSKKNREMVEGWRASILSVAREEMGHLLTVQNVLVLLGAPVNFDRAMLPWDHEFYPFPFSLEPLSVETLQCFIYAEMPRLDSLGKAPPGKQRKKAAPSSISVEKQRAISPKSRPSSPSVWQGARRGGYAPRRRALRRDHRPDLGPRNGFRIRRSTRRATTCRPPGTTGAEATSRIPGRSTPKAIWLTPDGRPRRARAVRPERPRWRAACPCPDRARGDPRAGRQGAAGAGRPGRSAASASGRDRRAVPLRALHSDL